jgi:hypothetical protein
VVLVGAKVMGISFIKEKQHGFIAGIFYKRILAWCLNQDKPKIFRTISVDIN